MRFYCASLCSHLARLVRVGVLGQRVAIVRSRGPIVLRVVPVERSMATTGIVAPVRLTALRRGRLSHERGKILVAIKSHRHLVTGVGINVSQVSCGK